MVNEVLENKDEIVAKLAENGLSADEIDAKIREKQEEYGGLLTEAGAAYAIAKDMKIDVGFEPKHEPVKVKEVKDGLEGVDIEGKVTQVFPVKKWEKETRHGRVGSIIVNDGSGEVRVTLWNNDCDMIENGEIQRGAKVSIQNASAKERNGLVELSMGYRSELKVLEKGVAKLTKLSEVAEGMNDVNFVARVERVFPLTEFEREGKKGKVLSTIISDGTERRLALWDDNAKWDGKIKEGDSILIEGAYVRINRGKPELNLGWRGRLVLNPDGVSVSTTSRAKLSDVKAGDTKEIMANVVKIYPPKTYEVCSNCRKKHDGECCGPAKSAMVVNAELDDGTGVIRGVFFRQHAEKLVGFSAEDYVKDDSLFDETKVLGEELVFTGTTKHNDVFNRDEFIVREFHEVDVNQEINMLKGDE